MPSKKKHDPIQEAINKNIQENIKYLRWKNEWTQLQLCARIDVTRQQLGSYEEGRCLPSLKTLGYMASLAECLLDTFIYNRLKPKDAEEQNSDDQRIQRSTAGQRRSAFKKDIY